MTTGDVVYSLRFSLIKILPEPGFDLGSTAGESCVLTARLHMLYIPSTINTHNIELQMVKVHLNNTKHITIANVYNIPPRDSTSTHYKTADKDIQHCIQHITTIPHSVLTGDVNAHSSPWHSYTDDHQ